MYAFHLIHCSNERSRLLLINQHTLDSEQTIIKSKKSGFFRIIYYIQALNDKNVIRVFDNAGSRTDIDYFYQLYQEWNDIEYIETFVYPIGKIDPIWLPSSHSN